MKEQWVPVLTISRCEHNNEAIKTPVSNLEPKTESLLWFLFDTVFISIKYSRTQDPRLPAERVQGCHVGGGKSHRSQELLERESPSNREAQPGRFSRRVVKDKGGREGGRKEGWDPAVTENLPPPLGSEQRLLHVHSALELALGTAATCIY